MCVVVQHHLAKGRRAAPYWIPPAYRNIQASSHYAPVQRLAAALPVRAFVLRHHDQPCADWIRANLIAVGLRPGLSRRPGPTTVCLSLGGSGHYQR